MRVLYEVQWKEREAEERVGASEFWRSCKMRKMRRSERRVVAGRRRSSNGTTTCAEPLAEELLELLAAVERARVNTLLGRIVYSDVTHSGASCKAVMNCAAVSGGHEMDGKN